MAAYPSRPHCGTGMAFLLGPPWLYLGSLGTWLLASGLVPVVDGSLDKVLAVQIPPEASVLAVDVHLYFLL